MRPCLAMICPLVAALLTGPLLGAEPLQLQNPELQLRLDTTSSGLPFIAQIVWRDTGEAVFSANGPGSGPSNWARNCGLTIDLNAPESRAVWTVSKDDMFRRAQASWRAGPIEFISHVDLAKQGRVIRVYTELDNHGPATSVASFPVWVMELQHPSMPELLWWESLSYVPRRTHLVSPTTVTLQSRTYSSDTRGSGGQVPFWMFFNGAQALGFGLAWSGGWRATFAASSGGLALQVSLPPEETQLRLGAGEKIVGPALEIVPLRAHNEPERRRQWLQERQAFAYHRWDMTKPRHPLIYNHWYSVRFDLSAEFIHNQVAAMAPYGFDAFVVDAGWYAGVGDWTADPDKFGPGELEAALRAVAAHGMKVGLWSCPWLKRVEPDQETPEIDEPRYRNRFMDAYSIDLAGTNFAATLERHIGDLERQFGMNWWKYDQEFLGQASRQGRMRKMLALQEALETVRVRYPGLTIESCMSGGRMINAFTDAIAQVHWIRDGGNNGYEHGRSNIVEALGAAQFLTPAKVQRWTNRPDTLDADDPELLKWYCRSCMIGVWGVSADLHKVSEAQRRVILAEVEHYRRLNQLKSSLHYEIQYPRENQELASIIFYDDEGSAAGILAFRWHSNGRIETSLRLKDLACDRRFDITDVDRKATIRMSGRDLAKNGLPIKLAEGELSKIYFLQTRFP